MFVSFKITQTVTAMQIALALYTNEVNFKIIIKLF